VILSQVIANYWKKVKQSSHSEVNQDHVILNSYVISLQVLILSYPYLKVFPKNVLKKRILMVIQVRIPFSEKFSSFVCNVLSMGLQPSYLWFQDSKASPFSLKGFEHQMGNFSYPVKTGLSGFGNRTVRFLRF
jgi:hypothetical protein